MAHLDRTPALGGHLPLRFRIGYTCIGLKIKHMRKTESGWNDAKGVRVFTAVWRAYRVLLARSEESKKATGLCDSDFRVLELLLQKGSQPVNVLGAEIDLTTGSITTAIDRLEARWLVVRKLDPGDRRVRMVELTSRGRRVIERASAEHTDKMEEALGVLSPQERTALLKLLDKIAQA